MRRAFFTISVIIGMALAAGALFFLYFAYLGVPGVSAGPVVIFLVLVLLIVYEVHRYTRRD